MRYCYCEANVRSFNVSVVYVVRLRIVFSKTALQKRGSMGPMEPPLDPPLACPQPAAFSILFSRQTSFLPSTYLGACKVHWTHAHKPIMYTPL